MKGIFVLAPIALFVVGCSCGNEDVPELPQGKPAGHVEVIFDATDKHQVYADFLPSKKPNSDRIVLLFHQARSNASEYETIAPKIAKLGFDCLAVDQRAGGDMWGRVNRTVNKSGAGGYPEAYNDLVGALRYAKAKKYTTIVAWGSSYSAALIFRLAAENPEVSAVVAFSPGEYMDEHGIVSQWAKKVTVPVLFACTPDEWEDGRSELFDQIASKKKTSVALAGGVHGSSTLIADKSTAAGQYMEKVTDFFTELAKANP